MPTRSSRPRFALACCASALWLCGCSSEGSGDWVNLYKTARNAWTGSADYVSLDRAAAVPYSTMGVRLDDGPEQIMLLATDSVGEQLWTASTRLAIGTRNGRVISTAGLSGDLRGHSGGTGEDWRSPHTYTWSADFSGLGLYGVPISCAVRPAGPEPITILGRKFATLRVEEHCEAEKIGWSFDNTYWVSSASGIVWRSIQHVSPKAPVLELEILRPPASFG